VLKEKIVRIRGKIGDWPVDLSIELEPAEWAQLGGQLAVPAVPRETPDEVTGAPRQDDRIWAAAQALLRQAGQLNGPQLLDRLESLGESPAQAKRLLVRLRHCAQVKVTSGADAPVFTWLG
jgi:hypothetical protein